MKRIYKEIEIDHISIFGFIRVLRSVRDKILEENPEMLFENLGKATGQRRQRFIPGDKKPFKFKAGGEIKLYGSVSFGSITFSTF
ncbi:hypothetical protein K502DRAFT_323791 [Neoconidiobolus thromboides FSU 785]|nr:hypothetical protein K502DRAFT_323791 [Neoconidiobolus thromboides FSU 785]